jgi:hypothetical protein
MSNKFEVEFSSDGPAGWVRYEEDFVLTFPWERTTSGFTIEVPLPREWNDFCDLHNALAAQNRREVILSRLGKAGAKVYWGGRYYVHDTNVEVRRRSVWAMIRGCKS